jgi:hypothetical protein
MSDLDERRRIYDEDRDIPTWLKWTFAAINRIGFPIVAFLLMWKLCTDSIAKIDGSLQQNTVVLMEVRDTISRVSDRIK